MATRSGGTKGWQQIEKKNYLREYSSLLPQFVKTNLNLSL